ncbi:CRE-CNX-1 protein [Caenorhabditis remanei]|uniref:CRE-CNX-1 protein n=1 Tax=Caenorhabditis remanei TaxID=31234 RepID=E3LS62_CAERE|nr:CRE-CNX-1 protein [Caenorhabditis remanei]
MLNRKWSFVFLALLLATPINANDDVFESEDEEVAETINDKEEFVPSNFVAPKLSEKSKPNFFDYFPVGSKVGQTWIKSLARKDDVDSDIAKYNGEWIIGAPTKVSIEGDLGLIVKTKARHHAIAAKLNTPFVFDSENFVAQYDVKFEEGQECGGGYLKLLSEGAEKDLANFQDKTPYTIMFGPDKCGASAQVHLIFRYKNPINGTISEYHAKQPASIGTTYWDDHNTHLFTLTVKPTGDFAVSVDGKSLFYGNMLSDVSPGLTPPKEIFDESDVKPKDWDEREHIEDETAVKPDDWDESEPQSVVDESATKPYDWNEDENELIPDPEAQKPQDWDEDMDGSWEAPLIDNPACKGLSGCGTWKPPTIKNPKYRGKWVRPRISNPAYKGKWAPRLIDNPNYFEPRPFEGLSPITAVGIELWTMSENIIFDNILITSSEEDASDIAKQTFYVKQQEEYRLAAASGNSNGIFQQIIDATNEKPWLWAVYILCILLPLVAIGVFCFGKAPKPAPNFAKKNDTYSADDDRVPNLVDDEEEEIIAEEDDEDQPGPSGTQNQPPRGDDEEEVVDQQPSSTKTESSQSSTAEEDDEEDDHVVHENEPVQPTEEVAKKSPKPSGGAKRRTARRGD